MLSIENQTRLREIISEAIAGNKNFFSLHEIALIDKGPCWVLHYQQFGGKNNYAKLCRGLVVRKPDQYYSDPLELILSLPFTRFFNRGETEAAAINFQNSEMIEKLDGFMAGVYFPDKNHSNPAWQTKKMVSLSPSDMALTLTSWNGYSFKLLPLVGQFVQAIPWTEKDTQFCYVFEFVHTYTKVCTRYSSDRHGLHLIGGRNIETLQELSEDELDVIASEKGIQRPRRWDAAHDEEKIIKVMQEASAETENFEGFVFRDKTTGERIKLKDEDYVRIHHLINQISYRNLTPLYLLGEESEVLAYFPEAKSKIDNIKVAFEKFVNLAASRVMYWKAKNLSRKELALALLGHVPKKRDRLQGEIVVSPLENEEEDVKPLILRYIDLKNEGEIRNALTDSLKKLALGKGSNDGCPKGFLRIIGLETTDEESEEC